MNSGAPMGCWSTRAKVVGVGSLGTGELGVLCLEKAGRWGQVVFSPTLVIGCLEGKWPAQGLPRPCFRDQVQLQTGLLCLLGAPKPASQCLSGYLPLRPAVLSPSHERTHLHRTILAGAVWSSPCAGPHRAQLLQSPIFPFLGKFAIRADKKSNPVVRTVKSVGMIAGGTGKGWSPG